MQKILVTGANGFVGHYLVEALLRLPCQVIATGRGENRLPFAAPSFSYATLDFTDKESLLVAMEELAPDVIVHSGAMSQPDACEAEKEAAFRTNVTGTMNLLAAGAACGSFFIFLSTDFVFDGTKGMYREGDARAAVNYYGQTKILAEDAVMQYAGDWSIVRTVLVYGKPLRSRGNLLTSVAAALERGERLHIYHDQVRTPTFVKDLVRGIAAIIVGHKKGIYHLCGRDVLTPYDMALAVAQFLGRDASLITPVTRESFRQPALRPLVTGLNISKARTELGYVPISFEEGLKETFSDEL